MTDESAVIHDADDDSFRDASGAITSFPGAGGSGVDSIAKAGSTPLTGDVTLTGGTNVTLTQAGQDISIAAAGGGAPSGSAGGVLDGTYPNPGLAAGVAGSGLSESSDVLAVNVDGSTIEISSDALRVKADGITANEIAAGAVGASELASTAVTPATYGTASKVGSFTVDADGRITAASEITIPGVGTGGTVKLYDYEVTGTDKASIDTNVDGTTVANFAGYDVLEFWFYHRVDEAVPIASIDVFFNNDTAGNYEVVRLRDVNTTVSGAVAGARAGILILGAGASDTAGVFTVTRFSIPNYLGTVGFKTCEIVGGMADPTAGNKDVEVYNGIWKSTAAIARIKVAPNTAAKKFIVGTRLLVYGR